MFRRDIIKGLGTVGAGLFVLPFANSCSVYSRREEEAAAWNGNEQQVDNLVFPTEEEVEEALGPLAMNENALGPSPLAVKAVKMLPNYYHRYGLSYCLLLQLRQLVAARTNVERKYLWFKPGSCNALGMLNRKLVSHEEPCVTSHTEFPIMKEFAMRFNSRCEFVPVGKDFKVDLAALAEKSKGAGMVYLSNPHNPLGGFHPVNKLEKLVQQCSPVPVVIDECYIPYISRDYEKYSCMRLVKKHSNVIVVRTFSKTHGLAGLRIGYYAAGDALLDKLDLLYRPISSLSLAAAIGAVQDEQHLAASREHCKQMRRLFVDFAKKHGFSYVENGQGNFFCFLFSNPTDEVYERLEEKGIEFEPIVGSSTKYLRITLAEPKRVSEFLSRFAKLM